MKNRSLGITVLMLSMVLGGTTQARQWKRIKAREGAKEALQIIGLMKKKLPSVNGVPIRDEQHRVDVIVGKLDAFEIGVAERRFTQADLNMLRRMFEKYYPTDRLRAMRGRGVLREIARRSAARLRVPLARKEEVSPSESHRLAVRKITRELDEAADVKRIQVLVQDMKQELALIKQELGNTEEAQQMVNNVVRRFMDVTTPYKQKQKGTVKQRKQVTKLRKELRCFIYQEGIPYPIIDKAGWHQHRDADCPAPAPVKSKGKEPEKEEEHKGDIADEDL